MKKNKEDDLEAYYKGKIEKILKEIARKKVENIYKGADSDINIIHAEGLDFCSSLIKEELKEDLDLDLDEIEEYEEDLILNIPSAEGLDLDREEVNKEFEGVSR